MENGGFDLLIPNFLICLVEIGFYLEDTIEEKAMKIPKLINETYLADLSHRIRTLPPDEAASALLECGTIVLLAGHAEIAYLLLIKLLSGELKISEYSSLAHPLKSILPSLCYLLEIECPAILSEQAMSIDEIEWYIEERSQGYKRTSNTDRWLHLLSPSSNWTEKFIHEITHPKADATAKDRFKTHRFIQDLHKVISKNIKQDKLQEAKRNFLIFEDVVEAWNIGYKTFIEYDILTFGIHIYLDINDLDSADKYILKYWNSLEEESRIGILYWLPYLPEVMERISTGILQGEINVSHVQAQELLLSIDNRTYDPQQIGFIPTVEDWTIFLDQWNQQVFEKLKASNIKPSKHHHYSEDIDYNCYHLPGATKAQIIELDQKLQTKLPVGYRNFLLASNGFVSLDRRYMFCDTDKIDWFIQENRDWAEIWSNSNDDISDEQYLQYGENQNCCLIRRQYMKTSLQISPADEGYIYLLNPLIIDNRNEWESWDFGNKYPGAFRYRSFWDMMQKLYLISCDS